MKPLPPTPPPPPERRVYTIDEAAQTIPEMRNTALQVDRDLSMKGHKRFDDGGIAIPLRTQPPPSDTESIQELQAHRGAYSRHNYENDRYVGTHPGRRYG